MEPKTPGGRLVSVYPGLCFFSGLTHTIDFGTISVPSEKGGGGLNGDFLRAVEGMSPVASVTISVALMLISGFLMTRLTKLLRLPNVTAYILAGILIGPVCLNLIPSSIIEGTAFLPDVALAFIAFGAGSYFRLSVLRRNGGRVVAVAVIEALMVSALIFSAAYFLLKLDFSLSVILAALSVVTAPSSTVMTIRQTGAKGDFVDTLLQVVALDDMVGLLAYSVALSVALAAAGEGTNLSSVLKPLLVNLGVVALGGVFGFLLKLLITQKRTADNKLVITVALLFAFCGVCALLDVSPLLGCMSMGAVYGNLAADDRLFRQLDYFTPPVLLLFFVRSGMSFRFDALFSAAGAVSLAVICGVYFLVRMAGKYTGAYLGCLAAGKPPKVRNYLGMALLPQAGVAIGLAELGARMLGGEAGSALQTVVLAACVLYELAGPACTKLALYLSGSYSNTLEALVPVSETAADGRQKTSLELLTERIQRIQRELPPREAPSPEEEAFDQAAEELAQEGSHYRGGNPRKFGRFF